MEQQGIPNFRRYGGYTAFIEGWGLYAESLGDEMGLYDDPYSKFGQLMYEIWRASRLVVDTGMHYLRWERQKAIDFMMENTARQEVDVVNEIDRYIVWPGQALAYKIGQLKISELRAKAKQILGDKFDIRDFHDELLKDGALPLDHLEIKMNTWITSQKK
jgi:prolyl oligopeptidase